MGCGVGFGRVTAQLLYFSAADRRSAPYLSLKYVVRTAAVSLHAAGYGARDAENPAQRVLLRHHATARGSVRLDTKRLPPPISPERHTLALLLGCAAAAAATTTVTAAACTTSVIMAAMSLWWWSVAAGPAESALTGL